MERQIGEIFEHEAATLQAVSMCHGCYFKDKKCFDVLAIGECSGQGRTDNTSVIFVPLTAK